MKKNKSLRVTFFGDSICVGQGVSIHSGWVTRTASLLDEISVSAGWEVVVTNASVNGNTTRQALERMPYDVQSHGVDVLIVQFGMNDCNYWQSDCGVPRVSKGAFAANLEEIIQRGRIFGAKQIFLHTNHPTTRTSDIFPYADVSYEDSNRAYNSIIRNVAAKHESVVRFNDIEEIFLNYAGMDETKADALLLSDKLHLSKLGHDLYFESVSGVIANCVKNILSET